MNPGSTLLNESVQSSEMWRTLKRAAAFAGEVVCETLWPTRCAICDTPGKVLCEECEQELPYVDMWRACPACGSPMGLFQCTTCNDVMLEKMGRTRMPFSTCASAVRFDEAAGALVRVFKDAGEQRLSQDMARLMARCVSPEWNIDALTYIPASKKAYRRRGFDHGALLAHDLAEKLKVPMIELLERPRTRDQRKFGARDRFRNLAGSFQLRDDALQQPFISNLLLIDDVFTTGATLCAASDVLKTVAQDIHCLTFARV